MSALTSRDIERQLTSELCTGTADCFAITGYTPYSILCYLTIALEGYEVATPNVRITAIRENYLLNRITTRYRLEGEFDILTIAALMLERIARDKRSQEQGMA